jgi:hypothetical protein
MMGYGRGRSQRISHVERSCLGPKIVGLRFTGFGIDSQPRDLGRESSSLTRPICSTYDTQLQFLALRPTSVQPSGARSRK